MSMKMHKGTRKYGKKSTFLVATKKGNTSVKKKRRSMLRWSKKPRGM